MIGKLYGFVDEIINDHIIVNVNGVGYVVYVPKRIIPSLGINEKISLYINDISIKDGGRFLYGFIEACDRDCLRLLMKINGIGHKSAMLILSTYNCDHIYGAISSGKIELIKVSGVGVRLLNRIVTELKEKVPFVSSIAVSEDALLALISLGFERTKIIDVLVGLINGDSKLKTDTLIRLALRELSK